MTIVERLVYCANGDCENCQLILEDAYCHEKLLKMAANILFNSIEVPPDIYSALSDMMPEAKYEVKSQ